MHAPLPRHLRAALLVLCTFGVALLAACERTPKTHAAANRVSVTWGTATRVGNPPAGEWALVLDTAGHPRIGQVLGAPLVLPQGACSASVVFARMGRREWYAAWWQPRTDGSATLVVSRTTNGAATWSAPVVADARDRSAAGCARPRPAIAVAPASGAVHLAYFLRAQRGTGIWSARSTQQGTVWSPPVEVLAEDAPAEVSIAAQGDTVVVAYTSPSRDGTRVGLVLSTSAGRTFDRKIRVAAAPDSASAPRVALRGGAVAVAWDARARGSTGAAPEVMVTVGAVPTPP